MGRFVVFAACVGGGAVLLGCAGGGGAGKVQEPDWVDVTTDYKIAAQSNPTMKGNRQWEPIVALVATVRRDANSNAYRVIMNLPAADLHRSVPGVLVKPGIGGCMTIQFWDSRPNGITVYGSDLQKAVVAEGSPGVCRDL